MTIALPRVRQQRRTITGQIAAILVMALALAGGWDAAQAAPANPMSVTLDAARAAHEAGRAVLIDIREPEEHATGVPAKAQLLPMRQIASRLAEVPTDPTRPVLLICNTQNRSRATAQALRERGYSHVSFVEGGMSEWARRGWPMVKPVR